MSARVTLRRIAETAGLSESTASRVLRDEGRVSPEAAAKVLRALRALAVVPPDHLLGEGGARIEVVAVVSPASVPVAIDPWEPLVGALTTQLFAQGRVALNMVVDQASTALVRQLQGQGVTRAIVVGPDAAAREAERLAAAGVEVLRLGVSATGDLPALIFDAPSALDLAVRHLVQLGHRRLGLVVPDDGDAATRISGFRFSVAQRLFIEATRSQAPVATCDETLVSARHAAGVLVEAGCSAVIACGPAATLGSLSAVRTRGLRIPAEFSLVSVGPVPDAELVAPGITQVGYDLAGVAVEATRLLERGLAARGAVYEWPPELVLRDSASRVTRR